MDRDWSEKLLQASKRENLHQERLFLELVDNAFDNCTLEVARVLMKTFTDKPDYGTQERVINVFATARNEIITRAILEELPRLLVESPEWAEVLIGTEVDKRPKLLQQIASQMSTEIKKSLHTLLENKEFKTFYPSSQMLII